MNHPPGTTAGNGDDFDPEQAAARPEQTQARSGVQFARGTPALFAFRAVAVLVACAALWLSVRGQDPYTGPRGWAVAVAVAILVINTGASAWVIKRAGDGRARAQRARLAWDGIRLVALVAAYVVIASLYHAGATYPVWGLYPANAPLLLAILVAAAAAARQRWLMAGACLAMAIVAVAAGFGGAADAWLIMGIGVCAVMLGMAAFTARAQRRSGVWPRLTTNSAR